MYLGRFVHTPPHLVHAVPPTSASFTFRVLPKPQSTTQGRSMRELVERGESDGMRGPHVCYKCLHNISILLLVVLLGNGGVTL